MGLSDFPQQVVKITKKLWRKIFPSSRPIFSYTKKARVIYAIDGRVRGDTEEIMIKSDRELSDAEINSRITDRARETSVLRGDFVADIEIVQEALPVRHLVL